MEEVEEHDEKDTLLLRSKKLIQDLEMDLKNEKSTNEELNNQIEDMDLELREKDQEIEKLKMDKYLL